MTASLPSSLYIYGSYSAFSSGKVTLTNFKHLSDALRDDKDMVLAALGAASELDGFLSRRDATKSIFCAVSGRLQRDVDVYSVAILVGDLGGRN